ncbi:MAG: phosphotransferase [Opitutaceae bacterium]
MRIDPYLRTVARRHPDLSSQINTGIDSLVRNRVCLIHGDYSPKNIMLQVDGRMVILDHEVAVFGDPAFDLAFLINHLLLKGVCRPDRLTEVFAGITEFFSAYCSEIQEAAFADPDERVGRLLPMLMLARIDGKSPVEYLTEQQREATRAFARDQILDPPPATGELIEHFASRFRPCPR